MGKTEAMKQISLSSLQTILTQRLTMNQPARELVLCGGKRLIGRMQSHANVVLQ